MYHNYTPPFLWAGIRKHDEDGSLNSTPKTMRSSEPGQILFKKKRKKIVYFVILSGFFFFFFSYSIRKFNKKRQCLRASPEIRVPVLL